MPSKKQLPIREALPQLQVDIAIGPERDTPSWRWVGRDLLSELSKIVTVRSFKDYSSVPSAKCVLMIKHPCSKEQMEALSRKSKLVYCPIDFISDEEHLRSLGWLFSGCGAIAVHCGRLSKYLASYNKKIFSVEHHDKFSVPCSAYKKTGYVLWVGGFQYAPYVLRYFRQNGIKERLRILSDIGNRFATSAAKRNAKAIGFDIDIKPRSVNGIEVVPWSEAEQSRMLSECKAAVDIKLEEDFNQMTKPPTKAQKYVLSGVPLAVNPSSYSYEYFSAMGLNLPSPTDSGRWLSEGFHSETAEFSKKLRDRLTLSSVAETYIGIFREVTKQ